MTMLHAPEWAPPTRVSKVLRPTMLRRRRAALILAGAAALTGVIAIGTGAPAAWVSFALSLMASGSYVAILRHEGRLSLERGFRSHSGGQADLSDLGDLTIAADGPTEAAVTVELAPLPAWRQALALARFLGSYAAGWALAPLVFGLTILVGKTPQDTTGQRWLANLQAAQVRLKEQSMRTLVVSAATTASVTATGTLVFGGAGMAAAAPISSAAVSSAATSASVRAAVTAASPTTYRVAAGDTLGAIAARFGTTWSALAGLNHIANPNLIYPGRVILLPSGTQAVPASTNPVGTTTYRVAAGDTLGAIAARFGTTWSALAGLNHIANPNLIFPGELLETVGSAPAATLAAVPVSAPPAAPAQVAPAPVTTSTSAQVAVSTALAQVGKPYVWAGSGPNAFDCSGLVMYAWAAAGVSLAHYSVAQYQDTQQISQSQLQPGDLVFYDTGSGAQPGHVTMYLGGGQVITADSPGTFVKVVPLDWDGIPMGFGRPAA
ncbi:MAG: LysM peptidoglycan-binding domain-containing protein [Acidimicrobiales bacterium]|nr:LysM peptidoglycan-binding domain-containing protein [Acidimicrobiales bacterium]